MGSWYWIGVSAGLGVAAGVLLAGFVGTARAALIAGAIAAGGAGAALGYGIGAWQTGGWIDRIVGIAAGVVGAIGAGQIVVGTLRRGGTRGGTATLFAGAALVAAGASFIPIVGYLEAPAVAALAGRLRRTRPERYAGLRTLARDR